MGCRLARGGEAISATFERQTFLLGGVCTVARLLEWLRTGILASSVLHHDPGTVKAAGCGAEQEVPVKAIPTAVWLGRILIGTAWAGSLVVAGIATLVGSWSTGEAGRLGVFGGVAAIAAGQFVFLYVVADRLCPMNNRRPADALQILAAAVFALALLGCLVTLFGGS